jgi:hypothetical protein
MLAGRFLELSWFAITDVKGMRNQAEGGVGGVDAGLPVSIIGILHSAHHNVF